MEHQDWRPVTIGNKKNDTPKRPSRPPVFSLSQKLNEANDVTEINDIKKKAVTKFGIKIQQIRLAKGYNQKQFAKFLDLSEKVIKDYEADRIQPEGHIRSRIMRKTGCKL